MENNKMVSLIRIGSQALMKKPGERENIIVPAADIYETAQAFIVKLDMPGASKEVINVTVDSKTLRIYCKPMRSENKNGISLYSEIGEKSYLREFNLGTGILLDTIQALFENGVLNITLPKSEEIKTREIQIQ